MTKQTTAVGEAGRELSQCRNSMKKKILQPTKKVVQTFWSRKQFWQRKIAQAFSPKTGKYSKLDFHCPVILGALTGVKLHTY